MARIDLAPEVFDDFDRFLDHMTAFDVADSRGRIEGIVQALDMLSHSPRIGRPVGGGLRELVIGNGASGFVALYRFETPIDTAFVLALRHQREDGFRRTTP